MDNRNYADAFTAEDGVIFAGEANGTCQTHVTATDAAGAQATAIFNVEVDKSNAVQEICDGNDACSP